MTDPVAYVRDDAVCPCPPSHYFTISWLFTSLSTELITDLSLSFLPWIPAGGSELPSLQLPFPCAWATLQSSFLKMGIESYQRPGWTLPCVIHYCLDKMQTLGGQSSAGPWSSSCQPHLSSFTFSDSKLNHLQFQKSVMLLHQFRLRFSHIPHPSLLL